MHRFGDGKYDDPFTNKKKTSNTGASAFPTTGSREVLGVTARRYHAFL